VVRAAPSSQNYMPKAKYTLDQFNSEFPDDDACLDYLFRQRYANLICCPRCGVVAAEFVRVNNRKCYACVHCRHQLYPMAGTIFHRSTTPLRKWFTAIYLFSVSKNGVAATELERHLGLTHKCAWRMAKQIRSAMKQDDVLLEGTVEADEAYYGGRRRTSNWHKYKVPILGVVERHGRAKVKVVDHASATTAIPFLKANVAPNSLLQTDESRIYNRAKRDFIHHSVKHGAYEFVRDTDYTNTIEGFWGLLKPTLNGTHRAVSRKYLQLYVNEAVWRYNRRQQPVLCSSLLEATAQLVSSDR
jgi:transposase